MDNEYIIVYGGKMIDRIDETISRINSLDSDAMDRCQIHLNNLTKPVGSMGVLEDIAVQLAGIYGDIPREKLNKMLLIMAGDHGLVEEGISGYPQDVTKQMVYNITGNGAGVNVLLNTTGADFVCVDVGINGYVDCDDLLQRKVKNGTNNIAKEPAMTREEAVSAICVGIDVANEYIDKGYNLLGIGEMGVGNTTASSAVLRAFSNLDVDDIVDRGAGIGDEALERKKQVVYDAVERNKPDKNDAIDVLAKVGGLEIGAMAGAILGAANKGVPIIIDGFIATAAALIAYNISEMSSKYMIPSHKSDEKGHKWMMDMIGLRPYLDMKMRLGEGSGAAIAFGIVDMAVAMINEMSTFDNAGVDRNQHE